MTSIRLRFLARVGVARLVTGIFLTVLGHTEATVVRAASPSRSDVGTAIATARDGDTVEVPSGTASWTSTLEITKGITIQGATTITGTRDDPRVSDATIIVDDVPRGTHG